MLVPKLCVYNMRMRIGVVLVSIICYSCYWCHGCLDEEKKALLQIKDSINHPNGHALPSWVGNNCCEWGGVDCNESPSHVISIDLEGRRTASLGIWHPNATLFSQFKYLVEIDLSNNQISMDGFEMLQVFCELKFLEVLSLDHNLLEGVLPTCLGSMHSLRVLRLARNKFTGNISSSLGNLTMIEEIDVGHNQLQGVVSFSMFSNLFYLETLIFSNNQLEVETESPTWVPLFQLSSLRLSNCNLNKRSGSIIPSFLSTQNFLVTLDLSHNSLVGSIPTWMLYNVSQLLSLKNNMFSSPFREDSGNLLSPLEWLDISDNNVHGSLPDNIGELFPSLLFFNMSTNHLQGSIPLSFGEMMDLEALDLSNNNLIGEMPQNLMIKGDSLKFLILSNNSLRGEMLPRDFNLTKLKLLQLHSNNFTGTIPPCLSNSLDLEYLDIRNNHLSGNVSSWFPVLPLMRVLLLGRNLFEGHIPRQLCQMQNLQFLDFSDNSLSGDLPSCLNEITSWKNLSLSSNSTTLGGVVTPLKNVGIRVTAEFTTKGILYSYEGRPLALMTGIDMSSNKLTGSIPFELGDLKEIRSLSLSNNLLTGHLPASFQNLINLESLDLSHNKLNGTIPQELVHMTSLSTFNVAFNNLSGKIPYEQQFHTFNESSFQGNMYLCGTPLERNCTFDYQPQDHNEEEEEEEEASGIIDRPLFFYLFVAVSYALGFWSVLFLLIFNKKLRQSFFRVIDGYTESCCEKISMLWCYLMK